MDGEAPFPVVDLAVALVPHRVGVVSVPDHRRPRPEHLGVHACDDHVLVVGAVEHGDAAQRGHHELVAPHEVVLAFGRRRRLERVHVDADRIESGHDVFDGGVLARGIHRLQHDQDGATRLRIQLLLELDEARLGLPERLRPLRLRHRARLSPRIEVGGQLHVPAGLHDTLACRLRVVDSGSHARPSVPGDAERCTLGERPWPARGDHTGKAALVAGSDHSRRRRTLTG